MTSRHWVPRGVRGGGVWSRVASAGVVAAGLLASIAACGPATNAGDRPTPASLVRVAAASDLRFAMDDLIVAFAAERPDVAVEVAYGSSGNLLAQITNGAPFDAFFSADARYPRELEQAGLAEPGTTRLYAVGQIVAWVPADSPLDVETRGLAVVADPTVRRVAIANPEHAPYGRAAAAALEAARLTAAAKPKLVLGESVSQAAQFVESGNADVGVIALSLALAPPLRDAGRFVVVPPESYPRLEQGAVVLAGATAPEAAAAFLDFVLGPEGRAVLDRYGFLLAGG